MECFFGSYNLPADNDVRKSSVVTFHIPEIGIRFKAPFDAVDSDHSDYASLLALLEFIDSNQKYFSNQGFEIFGDNLHVVNQINQREDIPAKYRPLLDKAMAYRRKYRFSLQWVAPRDNSAFDFLFD
jgi:hypothetical protein